jgi:hypothetical protein
VEDFKGTSAGNHNQTCLRAKIAKLPQAQKLPKWLIKLSQIGRIPAFYSRILSK